jgi:hypothetical protein
MPSFLLSFLSSFSHRNISLLSSYDELVPSGIRIKSRYRGVTFGDRGAVLGIILTKEFGKKMRI